MKENKKAFTIIELTLAMGFLGTMLFGIATLMIQITNIYQKGISIRGVNSTGREIISDLTRTINASPINFKINPVDDNGKLKTRIEQRDLINSRSAYFYETVDSRTGKQLGGVFCTGEYSYIWNTADNIRKFVGNDYLKNSEFIYRTKNGGISQEARGAIWNAFGGSHGKYYILEVNDSDPVYQENQTHHHFILPRLVRIRDSERAICKYVNDEKDSSYQTNFRFTKDRDKELRITKIPNRVDIKTTITENDYVELISDNEAGLALYNFTVLPATQNNTTRQIFYSGMFILATIRGGVNIKSNGEFCQGSDQNDGSADNEFTKNDFDYCAVNKFNFSARATGETNINRNGI